MQQIGQRGVGRRRLRAGKERVLFAHGAGDERGGVRRERRARTAVAVADRVRDGERAAVGRDAGRVAGGEHDGARCALEPVQQLGEAGMQHLAGGGDARELGAKLLQMPGVVQPARRLEVLAAFTPQGSPEAQRNRGQQENGRAQREYDAVEAQAGHRRRSRKFRASANAEKLAESERLG